MAISKFATMALMATLIAAAHGQVYFNSNAGAAMNEGLATADSILCTYLNVNCAPGVTGFQTPPTPKATESETASLRAGSLEIETFDTGLLGDPLLDLDLGPDGVPAPAPVVIDTPPPPSPDSPLLAAEYGTLRTPPLDVEVPELAPADDVLPPVESPPVADEYLGSRKLMK